MRALVVVVLIAVAAPRGARAETDPAWAAYDAAFEALAAGDRAGARKLLDDLAASWPDHPASTRARARLGDLGVEAPATAPPPAPASPTSRVARGELVLGMTVSGLFDGVEACVDACDEARSEAAAVMIGGGGALAATLALTQHGVRSGEAQLYTSAASWGRWNALGYNDGFSETSTEAFVSIGSQLAGLGVGIGLWKLWHPSSGDVALANSGLLWSSVLTGFGSIWFGHDVSFPEIVIAGDIGLALGAALASEVKMSRGRTLLIDTGGVLGALLGGLLAVSSEDSSDQKIGAELTISTALGLGIAAAATQHWDDR